MQLRAVAPFTGAWIEINVVVNHVPELKVAPFTGAWIEISGLYRLPGRVTSRSLHGGVD